MGRRNAPFYRIVVADREKPRDGRYIEVLGTYHPREKTLNAKKERVLHWLQCGAAPTETVSQLLRRHHIV